MGQVSIIVAGRSYRMSCDDGEEEHLEELGRRYDAAIDELRTVFGEIGDQRLMVMAAVLMYFLVAYHGIGKGFKRPGERKPAS